MTDYFPAADIVIAKIEGGWSNVPGDSGGETKWGVARNKHPEISDAAWGAFTSADAMRMRLGSYWIVNHCGAMPWELALAVYDDSINHGDLGAADRLQRVLGVEPDGDIGPITLAAIPTDPKKIRRAMLQFMYRRAVAYAVDVNADRFLNGWLNRLVIVTEAALSPP